MKRFDAVSCENAGNHPCRYRYRPHDGEAGLCGAGRALSASAQVPVAIEVFSEVEPDPSTTTVERGTEMLARFQPDCIIALGGGSPMDAPKAMWLFYEYPDTDFNNLKQNSWISASGSINIRSWDGKRSSLPFQQRRERARSNFVCRHHGQRAGEYQVPAG